MRYVTAVSIALGLAGCNQSPSATESTASAPVLPDVKPGPNTLFVNVERVQRRTCPSITCGNVGWISERQVVEALEKKDGWVRITQQYDASCVDGQSEYVDDGKKTCTPDNGITSGKFAEWVPMSALSKERPADPAATATDSEALIAQSDDFKRYRKAFVEVTNRLIADGRCTADDFREMGGWIKSVNQNRNEPVYFTYCGGMTAANKVYINAETKRVIS